MLWVDKYRPTKIDDLSYHHDVTKKLLSLANCPQQLPHLFFYGPTGSGKKTRIQTLLRQLYGPSCITKLKLDKRLYTIPNTTNKVIEINMVSSNYHIEMSPGDVGLYDRYVVQDIIKEMASTKNIVLNTIRPITDSTTTTTTTTDTNQNQNQNSQQKIQYKTVVLMDVDQLSKQAQAALRRTMEKYSASCRLILCCTSSSKVMEAVRSRCLGIRIGAPSIDEITTVLKYVANKECVTLPDELAVNIARESSRNVRRAILMLEACYVQQSSSISSSSTAAAVLTTVQKTDWEIYITQMAHEITKEQSPQRLVATREKLYELLVNCIPPTIIMKTLAKELIKNLDDSMKQEVMDWAAHYERRIALGSKEIFHLEAFVAKYMAIYKRYLNELFG